MTLEEARGMFGLKVVYRPHPDAVPEEGVVTSVGARYVYVRYSGDVGSKATAAEVLEPLARES